MKTNRGHRLRATTLAMALLLGTGGVLVLALLKTVGAWNTLRHLPFEPTPVDAAPTVLWAALAGASGWAVALLTVTAAQLARTPRSPGAGPHADRRADRSARRLAMLLLAITAAGGTPATAYATTTGTAVVRADSPASQPKTPSPSFEWAPQTVADSPPEPGWTPQPPARTDQRAAGCSALMTGTAHGGDDLVTVRRGDSLWSIVARTLGDDADPAAVAALWPRWYEANRAVIGDDPGIIVPGMQLRAPSARGGCR